MSESAGKNIGSESAEPLNKQRRRFLTIGTGLVGVGVGYFLDLDKVQKSTEAGGVLLKEIGDEVRNVRDELGELRYRLDLLRKLFRISGRLHIPAPRVHPLYHKPGPHDLAAMKVAALMYSNPRSTDLPSEAELTPVDALFSVGSPVNSALAATFIPTAGGSVGHKTKLISTARAVPYHFWGGKSDSLVVKSASQLGTERAVRNHGLVSEGVVWHPPELADRNDWLKTDFLLLTVVPWNAGGGRAIFAGGGHGPGTRALELLLEPSAFPLANLESLVGDLEGAQAFQVVFEVAVNNDGIYSMPCGLRVSSNLPPKRLESSVPFMAKSDEDVFRVVSATL